MDGGEAGDGIALMVFDGPFDFVVSEFVHDLEVLARLLLVEFLEHGLDDAASGEPDLLLQFLVDLGAALPLDLSDVALGELGEQFPDEVDFLLAVLGQRFPQRLDDLFALLGLFVDFVENGAQVLVDVFLEDFGELLGEGSGPEVFEVHVPIDIVALEVFVLFGQSDSHLDLVVYVLLRSVLHSHVPQL